MNERVSAERFLSALNRYKIRFHYTTYEALEKIITTKIIRATNVLYLNDSEEIKHAYKVILTVCDLYNIKWGDDEIDPKFLASYRREIEYYSNLDAETGIFISSFSSRPDQLSQWRGYCPNGSGVCIGFDFSDRQEKYLESKGYTFIECNYLDINKDKAPNFLPPEFKPITAFLIECNNYFISLPHEMEFSKRIWLTFEFKKEKLLQTAVGIKHPGFEEEKEWRLISKPILSTDKKTLYRVGKSMMIPYREIELCSPSEKLNIPAIWIGPTPHPNLAQSSVQQFLNNKEVYSTGGQLGLDGRFDELGNVRAVPADQPWETPVFLSKVPYRTW